MKKIVFDIETDGLLEAVTRIHTLVLKDVETGEVVSCADQVGYKSIRHGLALLADADAIFGHNIIAYDLPVIRKLYPKWVTRATAKDTFVIAASRFAHVKDLDYRNPAFPKQLAGRHSLKAWGHRLGLHKIDYDGWCKEQGIEDPWAQWRPEMQTYCEGDVETTTLLVRYLSKSGLPPEMVETELELKQLLVDMETHGWPFDMDKAIALQGRLSDRRHQLTEELVALFGSWQVSLGMWTPKRDNKRLGYVAGVPVERFKTITFNPGSRQHIANRLITLYGWKPDEYTESGEVKVDETTLKGLPYPPIPQLTEYLLIDKRLGQLAEGKEAWMAATRRNRDTALQHIHGRINQSGTITHRASHSKPNTGQVPRVGSPFGADCRELWRVPDGWYQIGADASGLEARCLGHFVARYDGGAYAKLLLEGDIHTYNRIALGLPDGVDASGKKFRDRAKTWYYAWMFGAGPEKLGKTLAPDAKPSQWKRIGREKQDLFLSATPALKYLIDSVQQKVTNPGYILGLDGRPVYLRSAHSALNTLIQSAGAIICKRWLVLCARELRARYGAPGWTGLWSPLGWIHDELQTAVRPEIVEDVKTLLVQQIESLTEHFRFRCPLTGEAKHGLNWKETH